MNFKELLSTIGKTALVAVGATNPLVGAAISTVNKFLPIDKQLPDTSTGQDVISAVESMSPEQRSSLMEKKIDLKIAQEEGWTERYIAMTSADGQSSRPYIALIMAWAVFVGVVGFMLLIGYEVVREGGGFESIGKAAASWSVIGTIIGIPAGILAKYFGELRKEQSNRQASVSGMTALIPKVFNPFNK